MHLNPLLYGLPSVPYNLQLNLPSDAELRDATLEGMAATRKVPSNGTGSNGGATPGNEAHNQSNRGRRGSGKTSASMTPLEVPIDFC